MAKDTAVTYERDEPTSGRAIDAFGRTGFFILVDDRQVETLDETIVISPARR